MSPDKAYLLLEDGLLIKAEAIGKQGTATGEICFNTGMTGYQEMFSDPSYYGQIIVNTVSHVGNYGTIDTEEESHRAQIRGLVVNELSQEYSCSTASKSLSHYLEKHDIVGIAGVDTRMLVRHIRGKGTMNVIISSELEREALKKVLDDVPTMKNLELASKVSTSKPYFVGSTEASVKVAILDLGVKKSILTNLVERDCYCQIFPATTSFETMSAWNPHGYLLSNGPGDPSVMDYAIDTATKIIDANKLLFGICMGHQIMALASGLTTYKMHHGHRGLNHPVKNLKTGLCEITSQNHGFVVDEKNLDKHPHVEVTHIHLNDNTIMGIKLAKKKAFSVQYHPEASPGTHDARYFFDDFVSMLYVEKSLMNG